jgi:hypothetical protein
MSFFMSSCEVGLLHKQSLVKESHFPVGETEVMKHLVFEKWCRETEAVFLFVTVARATGRRPEWVGSHRKR